MSSAARRLATYSDLEPLEESGRRVEIIDGEIVEKAMPSGEHGDAQAGVLAPVRGRYHRRGFGGWWILVEVDVRFELHQVYRPDLAGWGRDRWPERPTGTPLDTVPDWVCEVLSPSTAHRDIGPKRACYHRHRVEHYWQVDTEHRILTVLRWTDAGYVVAVTATVGDHVRAEPFDEVEIDVGSLFGAD